MCLNQLNAINPSEIKLITMKQPIEKHHRSSRHCIFSLTRENHGLSGAPEGILLCGLSQLSSSLSSKSSSLSLKPLSLSSESGRSQNAKFVIQEFAVLRGGIRKSAPTRSQNVCEAWSCYKWLGNQATVFLQPCSNLTVILHDP